MPIKGTGTKKQAAKPKPDRKIDEYFTTASKVLKHEESDKENADPALSIRHRVSKRPPSVQQLPPSKIIKTKTKKKEYINISSDEEDADDDGPFLRYGGGRQKQVKDVVDSRMDFAINGPPGDVDLDSPCVDAAQFASDIDDPQEGFDLDSSDDSTSLDDTQGSLDLTDSEEEYDLDGSHDDVGLSTVQHQYIDHTSSTAAHTSSAFDVSIGASTTASKPILSIASVICVARTSSRQKQKFVDKLHSNNELLYNKFQRKCHPLIHACSDGDCPAEFKSIVVNGHSSNTNVSTSAATDIQELHQALETFAAQAKESPLSAILIFSRRDGFFTNGEGFKAYFMRYRALDITMYMYTGGSCFESYTVNGMLSTIIDCENGIRVDTPYYRLLAEWVAMSINKENVATALRDNRQINGSFRNVIDEDSDPEGSQRPPVSQKEYTATAKSLRKQAEADQTAGVKRYDLDGEPNARKCPEHGCNRTFSDFKQLLTHIVNKCIMSQTCVLCPNAPPWSFTGDRGKDHIRCHLPPQIKCNLCSYMTRNRNTLFRHRRTHKTVKEPSKNHICPICEFPFHKKNALDRHIESVHTKNGEVPEPCERCGVMVAKKTMADHRIRTCRFVRKDQPIVHKCPECPLTFEVYGSMRSHRAAVHVRRVEVLGFAERAGFISAGDTAKAASSFVR